MKQNTILTAAAILLLTLGSPEVWSQTGSTETRYNPITTAVPFLTITPDSRHGAMGDVGAATSADANAQYWNPSKLAFTEEKFGLSLSFTPWLRQLVNDVNLAYLSGYWKLSPQQTIGASLRYFSMGEIQLTDQNGTNLASVKPNEFALDVSYSRKLSEYLAARLRLLPSGFHHAAAEFPELPRFLPARLWPLGPRPRRRPNHLPALPQRPHR